MNDGSSGGGAPSASAASPFFERFRRFAGLAPRAADANAAEGSEDSAEPPSPARSGSSAALRAIQDNVRRLGGYTVADAMVSRAEVEALEEGATLDEVVEAFRNGRHSRLPVYRETLDDPLGFVHVKDIFKIYGDESQQLRPFRLRDHLRKALMAPPSMMAAALLQKMRVERVHMAFVIDEYGGVDGLVTNEDLVELIVGDIVDEHDDETEDWALESEDVWLLDARASIENFEREIGVELYDENEEVDSIGGLVTALIDRVPQAGEILIHPDGHEFEILEADPRRVKRLRFRLARRSAAPSADAAAEAAPTTEPSPASEAPAARAGVDLPPDALLPAPHLSGVEATPKAEPNSAQEAAATRTPAGAESETTRERPFGS